MAEKVYVTYNQVRLQERRCAIQAASGKSRQHMRPVAFKRKGFKHVHRAHIFFSRVRCTSCVKIPPPKSSMNSIQTSWSLSAGVVMSPRASSGILVHPSKVTPWLAPCLLCPTSARYYDQRLIINPHKTDLSSNNPARPTSPSKRSGSPSTKTSAREASSKHPAQKSPAHNG